MLAAIALGGFGITMLIITVQDFRKDPNVLTAAMMVMYLAVLWLALAVGGVVIHPRDILGL